MSARPISEQIILRAQSLGSGTADLTIPLSKRSVTSAASGNGSTTTLVDTALSTTNTYLGRIVRFTSGTNNGLMRYISGYVASTSTATFAEALPAATATNDTYEIIPQIPINASSLFVMSITSSAAGGAATQAVPVSFVNSITGERWALTTNVTGFTSASMPGLINVARGDLTVLVDSTNTWAAATDYYIVMGYM